MKKILYVLTFLSTSFAFGQHCPWDCSGMVMIQTSAPHQELYKMGLKLMDENKKEVIDTIFGTRKETYDDCAFLTFEDFTALRKRKIAIHHWYQYDTLYQFAEGNFIVKFNYCKYSGKKLFLHYYDCYTHGIRSHYIEIPANKRIYLHNYNAELRERKIEQLKRLTQTYVLKLSCDDFQLRDYHCK